MASGRRQEAGTPSYPTITQSPRSVTVSVEEWESKAPLSDLELRSVNLIRSACEVPPLPVKFISRAEGGGAGSSTRTGTPLQHRPATGSSRPGTPLARSLTPQPPADQKEKGAPTSTHELQPVMPIQTPQQFYDWFTLIDRSVAHAQESHFRAHAANVQERLDACQTVLNRIEEVEKEVDDMTMAWMSVEESGKSLKEACEKLLQERDDLLELTDEIEARLDYFQELEHATRMLNHPGESLVLQTDFLYMVERVDVCIDYLKAHRHFREAEIYLFRYQQCLTRAMTLIKMFFVGSLRALCVDVAKRLSEKDVSPTAQMHLLYTRFRTVSAQLAPLLGELERRAKVHPQELSALLSECHSAYFSTRKSLLVSRLAEEIRGLDPAKTELVELTRAGCSYLKQLCTDEFELYRDFFSTGEDQLYQYLENLCDYLYDDLRPRILHEPRLTALCEVCTVLQALMVLDVPALADEDEDEADELVLDFSGKRRRKGLGRLHISHLLQAVLQDAQTRLFFKAQSIVQSDVRFYVPKPEDLSYPDILVAAAKPSNGLEVREKESVSELFKLSSTDKQETWYPTLRKTVWVLSQLRDFVKPVIFEDIAQEAVVFCRQSLVAASDMIKAKSTPSPGASLDAQLFLVRHLLILKEMTRKLELGQKPSDSSGGPRGAGFDNASVTDALATMLSRTTSLFPDALFASLGMQRTEDSIREARHDIDLDLRRACEEVISQCVDPICQPLRSWLESVRGSSLPASASQPMLMRDPSRGQDTERQTEKQWTKPSYIQSLNEEFRRACETQLRANVGRLKLYLEDDRTAGILLDHVRERIADEYGTFREVALDMAISARQSGSADDSEGSHEVQILSASQLGALLLEICSQ